MHSCGVRFIARDKNSCPPGGYRLRSWDSMKPPKEREGAVRKKQAEVIYLGGTPMLKGGGQDERI